MDIFGEIWANHENRLIRGFQETVTEQDEVLIAGDISWAMREQEAGPDIDFVNQLPGKKILLKGNHDYWWSTKKRVQLQIGRAHV